MPVTPGKLPVFHEGLIDYQLANPQARTKEIAAAFGRTPQTISMIINSDLYKMRFHHRRREYQEKLHAELAHKSVELAGVVQDELIARVRENPAKIPFDSLEKLNDSVMERLGFGVKGGTVINTGTVNNTVQQVVSVGPDVLYSARERLRDLERVRANEQKRTEVFKHDPSPEEAGVPLEGELLPPRIEDIPG